MDVYRGRNVRNCCKNNWEYLTRLFNIVVAMKKNDDMLFGQKIPRCCVYCTLIESVCTVRLYFPALNLSLRLSWLPGHSDARRFHLHLFWVINVDGGWQPSTAADKAQPSFGTLQSAPLSPDLCTNYTAVIHVDCLLKDPPLAPRP